jgi:hypothetical protein
MDPNQNTIMYSRLHRWPVSTTQDTFLDLASAPPARPPQANRNRTYDLLEFVLQSELQLAIGQVGAGDFSEITVAKELVRIRELRCVKRIEKFRPKL